MQIRQGYFETFRRRPLFIAWQHAIFTTTPSNFVTRAKTWRGVNHCETFPNAIRDDSIGKRVAEKSRERRAFWEIRRYEVMNSGKWAEQMTQIDCPFTVGVVAIGFALKFSFDFDIVQMSRVKIFSFLNYTTVRCWKIAFNLSYFDHISSYRVDMCVGNWMWSTWNGENHSKYSIKLCACIFLSVRIRFEVLHREMIAV